MSVDVVDLGTFSRQWAVEGRRIAWLLGAGASVSAQVPTASQIVLDLLSRVHADAHHLVTKISISVTRRLGGRSSPTTTA